MNKFGLIVLTVFIAAGVSFGTFKVMERSYKPVAVPDGNGGVKFVSDRDAAAPADYPDFTQAAGTVSQQVVHIKVQLSNQTDNALPAGYDGAPQQSAPVMASGSGVILSQDGYIVTNNHVVEDATSIQVVLTDKRTFQAKLVGRDPNTDLALIKIDVGGLSPVKIGNSDQVKIGQWVLAIGYPFSLNTTVTAGIVSAKERSIGIIGSKRQGNDQQENQPSAGSAVEAYIQTDAAINPGNSGGALINANGELIGINAAIASQTGGYEGYGFAIPINLAQKIVDDLKKYGIVKRGMLGVSFPSPATEDEVLRQRGINPGSIKGVYITGVQDGSAAAAAGLKEGDIIQSIDGNTVNSSVELSERIARHHPDDQVKLSYLRQGKTENTNATLKGQPAQNQLANTGPSLNEIYNKLGAKFAPLNAQLKQRYQVNAGMVVTAIARGGFFEQVGIEPGSVIVSVNGVEVNNPVELNKAFTNATPGTVRIACITPDGSKTIFNLSLGA
ncbi:MAG: PDZ domain-containing protein [Sphingobacteriaceae bacterium]|nr:MAG: PDZ domain-containing protein [Sphingobacteriaceae bacterium]